MDSSTPEIRLAFLLGRLKRGGAELQMLALARGLVSRGYRVDFLCRSGQGPLDDGARAVGARVLPIGELSSSETAALTRFAHRASKHLRWITTARRERYDVVDAWLYPNDVFSALTRRITGIPVVAGGRRNLRQRPGGPVIRPIYALANRMTDVVVANSEVAARQAMSEPGLSPSRVRVIRAGVAVPRQYTEAERQAQRATLGAGDGDILIGSVGNFRSMKRQDLLIDAFARLLREHQDIRLVLVGDGDLRPTIENHIRDLGLERFVVLTGSVSDLPPLYAAFDLFVQASNSESLPNVILEASVAGLPIVATAAGGTDEVIRDGETGLLTPVDDLHGMVSAIRMALADEEMRRRLGRTAREHVLRDYGIERLVEEYDMLYREHLRKRSPRHPAVSRWRG